MIRLITVGMAIAFLGASLTAPMVPDLDVGLAFVLGAIIVVSGPTVVGSVLNCEGAVRPGSRGNMVEGGSQADPGGAPLPRWC